MPTLTSAHDLITAVPFLIGFHPTNSIVVIAVKEDSIGVAMRIDLPLALDYATIDLLAQHVVRDNSQRALIIAYMPDDRDDGDSILIALGAGLISNGIDIQESIVAKDGRYRSIICRDLTCCPSVGKAMPAIDQSQMAVEHVIAGIPMPFADISELINSLSADPASLAEDWIVEVTSFAIPGDCEESLELQRLRRDGIETMELLCDDYRIGRGPTNRTLVARMIGRMSDVQVRDYALGVHDEDNYDLYFTMWRELLRLAPPGFIAPIACIVAAMSYEAGDGALAQRALDRALEEEERYPLAGLLRRVFNAGWPPQSFANMRAELHPKVIEAIFH